MSPLEFLAHKGLKVNSPARPYDVTVGELAAMIGEYSEFRIGAYMKLREQYKKTGCKLCQKAIKEIESEWKRYINKAI